MKRFSVLRWIWVHPLAGWVLRATGPVLLALLFLRVVDFSELGRILRETRISWLLLALAATQLIIVMRAFRWQVLHRAFSLRPASIGYHLRLAYAIGLAAVLLPQVLSPFSRFLLLVQDRYPAARVGAGSALEKGLELGAYVAFGLSGLIYLGFVFSGLVWWAAGLAAGLLIAAALLYAGRSHIRRLFDAAVSRLFAVGEEKAADVSSEITALEPSVLARLAAWSLLIALTQATMLYLLSRALSIDLSYPFMVATWGIIALSVLLPLSFGGIGTREAVLVVAFEATGHSADAAVALGFLVLAVVLVGSSPGAFEWLRRLFVGAEELPAGKTIRAVPSVPATIVHTRADQAG